MAVVVDKNKRPDSRLLCLRQRAQQVHITIIDDGLSRHDAGELAFHLIDLLIQSD